MSAQQQPRPWFRLATIIRPAAPAPAPPPPPPSARSPAPTSAPQPPVPVVQPPPPISSYRQPVALPRSPPPAATTAPPSPVAPPAAPLRLPIVSPSSVTPTTPRSPQITGTGAPPPAASSVASPTPRSPAAVNGTFNGGIPPPTPITRSPAAPAPPPPETPAIPYKPESPIMKNSYSSPPASPGQKASAPRPVVSSSSPKTELVSSSPSTPILPTSPVPKTWLYSQSPPSAARPSPVPPPTASPVSTSVVPMTAVRSHAASHSPISSPKTVKPSWEKSPPPPPPQAHLLLKADTTSPDYLEPIPQEAEQKTMLMQDTNHENPKVNLKSSGERQLYKKEKLGTYKDKNSDASPPEFGLRVVTLAGENKGAVMDFSPAASRKKYDLVGQNFWSNNGKKLGSDKAEGRYHHQMNNKEETDRSKMKPRPPMDAFVNRNFQGVNNSILYNSTYKNCDPGVHLSVSTKGNGIHGLHLHEDTDHHDS